MADVGNYSFFNHNLLTTTMQQSFDRPKLLQQRRPQSAGNRLDSSSNKAVESKKDTVLLVREGDAQNAKFVPHPSSSPRSNTLSVDQQQADLSTQSASTPIKSNSGTTVLHNEPTAEDEVTLSSSNDSLTSVSDSEENSISKSESKNKSKPIHRDSNSTLPTLPKNRTLETGLYESVHPSERNPNDIPSVQTGELNDQRDEINSSGLYDSVHPNDGIYKNQGAPVQDDLQQNSTSDLRQIRKALEELATDDSSTGETSGFSSSGLVPRVSARRARTRSGNFLKKEMDRYFPDRQICIFVATWNMHEEKEVPFHLIQDFLIPESTNFLQDLYVIGLQESTSQRKEWEIRLQETLGPSHVLMYSCSFGLLHLAVFIRRELVWFCSSVSEDSVSTRVGHMIKTKGALAVSFSIFGTSFLFIDSHFTSDEGKAMDRVNDYKTICKSLSLSPEGQPNGNNELDLTDNFDRVFWLGDFNFRVTLNRSKVDGLLEQYKDLTRHCSGSNIVDLLAKDELLDLKEQGKVFVGFTEPPIKFLPTYKYDIQSDNYDSSSKNRTPSWTDRVLYRSRDPSSIQPVIYSSCVFLKTSDHRPVFGIYQVKLNLCRENIPLTGGQYIRDVYVEANRRRGLGPSSQKQSAVCIIL